MTDNQNLRATVFIGSSKEGLPIAEAIQLNLDHACEVTIWSQGLFGLGEGTLESLVDRLDSFDFAILVLTPDDVIHSRNEDQPSPRDNVLLELGLFIGALGRKRSFAVYERIRGLKLPSDLAGVTLANFQLHSNGNVQSSVGAATTLIKGAIQQLGKRQQKISANIDVNTQFQIMHDLLDNAPEQFLIWMHETNRPIVRQDRMFGGGIRYVYGLRNHAGGQGSFSMDDLCRKLPDAGLLSADLRGNVALTERGNLFAAWLVDNGHKASQFKSDIGEWGEPFNHPVFNWPPQSPFPSWNPMDGQQPNGNTTPPTTEE